MTKPCSTCKHNESKNGYYYCALKKRLTSTARITGGKGSHKEIDCHEVK